MQFRNSKHNAKENPVPHQHFRSASTIKRDREMTLQ